MNSTIKFTTGQNVHTAWANSRLFFILTIAALLLVIAGFIAGEVKEIKANYQNNVTLNKTNLERYDVCDI